MGQCLSPPAGSGRPTTKRDNGWAYVPHSPLSGAEILQRIQQESSKVTVGGKTITFGSICFRGYYPDTPYKANQDDYAIITPEKWGNQDLGMFAVFDGHGHVGEKCAQFVSSELPTELMDGSKRLVTDEGVRELLGESFLSVNRKLHLAPDIDDTLSGTTAVAALIIKDVLWVANVGDSRCILVQESGPSDDLVVKPMSLDQTPYRRDERARVKKSGARVLNMDMLEGLEPVHDDWDMTLGDEVDEGGDPPRIWAPDGAYPGTAFTRSIGDSIAEELGVTGEPEIERHVLSNEDQLLIIASDGIWEFLTNKEVLDIAKKAEDPQEAACLLWKAAYKEWITKEVRTDDITIIVLDLADYYSGMDPTSDVQKYDDSTPSEKPKKTRRGSTKIEALGIARDGENGDDHGARQV